MAEKELAVCDECGSLFLKGSSQMMGLCPECAHVLYGSPETQKALLDKMEGYLNHTQSRGFQKEMGAGP